jgi:hypothetical protein
MASEAYLRPPHPRRPPAQRSVSLRHYNGPTPGPKYPVTSSQTEGSSGSPSSNKPNVSKADSGESSNADKWFDGANNNADRKNSTALDSESSIYLAICSSLLTNPRC